VPGHCQYQTAYQILVATSVQRLNKDDADCWNSGKTENNKSINIEYRGVKLKGEATYYWKVRVWGKNGKKSEYSEIQEFKTGIFEGYSTTADNIESEYILPARSKVKIPGHFFFDFGRDAAGTVQFTVNTPYEGREVVIRLGEKLAGADFLLKIEIPANMTACVEIGPGLNGEKRLYMDNKMIVPQISGSYLKIDNVKPGKHLFTMR